MSTLTDTAPSNAADRLILLPAVDVQAGQAVQLIQGVSGSERIFGDPREAALRWQSEHAEWLHLVDLDAAFGRGDNAAVIADVVAAMEINVELSGGIRDDASLEQLVVLSNLESLNSVLIRQGLTQSERLSKLNEIAISQMRTLLADSGLKKLKG